MNRPSLQPGVSVLCTSPSQMRRRILRRLNGKLSLKRALVSLGRPARDELHFEKGAHMSSNYTRKAVATCIAALMATTFETLPASAQGSYAPPPGSDQEAAPPSGSYAEPPPGEDQGGDYDDQAQQQDEQYAQSYSEWAARNC